VARAAIAVAVSLLSSEAAASAAQQRTASPAVRLDPGRDVYAQLAVGAQDAYEVVVEAGQAVRVLIDQRETDLVAEVVWVGGARRRTVDARERGIETVTLITATVARARITIRHAAPGRAFSVYGVRIDAHPSSDSDRLRARAEWLTTQARAQARDERPGALQRAALALDAGRPLWQQIGDPAGDMAVLSMIGDLWHADGQLERAAAAYGQALTRSRAIGDVRSAAELVNNLGVLDWRRGDLNRARAYFDRAVGLWAQALYPPGTASTLTNQGNLAFESGDYQSAIERFDVALKVFEDAKAFREKALVLNNLGVTHRSLGDYARAINLLERAGAAYLAASDTSGAAGAYLRRGQIHLDRGELVPARDAVLVGMALIPDNDDPLDRGDGLHLMGQIAAASGDLRGALLRHGQARDHYERIQSPKGQATSLHHQGVVLRRLGRPDAALRSLNEALDIRRGVGLRDTVAETLYELALTERDMQRLDRARSHLQEALAITEDVRGRVAGAHARSAYLATRQSYFAALIGVLLSLHAEYPNSGFAAAAFAASDRQRARSLVDALVERNFDFRFGLDPVLLAQEQEIRREMDLLAFQLDRLTNAGSPGVEIDAIRGALEDRVAAYRALQADMRRSSPEYARLESQLPITLSEVHQLLDSDTVLLRFALGDPHSYLFLVTNTSMRVIPLGSKAAIETVARRVSGLISLPPEERRLHEHPNDLEVESLTLSTMLFGQVAGDIAGRRLLIVCDGALQLVPFAALPDLGGPAILLEQHEIVALPSAATLAVLRRQTASRQPPPKTLAVFANPVYDAEDRRVRSLIQRRERTAPASPSATPDANPVPLPRLPFSGREAAWISDFVPTSQRLVALGLDASRAAAMSSGMRDYRIVHFAAHAMVDDEHPELSRIALSSFERQGAAVDGSMRLHDIHEELDLRADLVVISACQTAVGTDVPGEGLMGLARGFFAAGSPRVIASLYAVDDPATAQLMRELYRALLGSNRKSPAAALRVAQLKMIEAPSWTDPYYWSAFVLLGEPR
jgi:CHAT domain-containing protein